jgi:hypothetical protein
MVHNASALGDNLCKEFKKTMYFGCTLVYRRFMR